MPSSMRDGGGDQAHRSTTLPCPSCNKARREDGSSPGLFTRNDCRTSVSRLLRHASHGSRETQALARSDAPALFKLQPPSNLAAVRLANHATDLRAHLNSLLEEMGVISEMSDEVVLVEARSMSWSRRERRERQRLGASFLATPATTAEPVLRCRITVGTNDLQVEFLFGRQRAIFDSFVAHVRSRLSSS